MNDQRIRVTIRGYLGRTLQFTQAREAAGAEIEELAFQHAISMALGFIDMVEFEFLDEPDVNQRFLRLATNPQGMVMPFDLHAYLNRN